MPAERPTHIYPRGHRDGDLLARCFPVPTTDGLTVVVRNLWRVRDWLGATAADVRSMALRHVESNQPFPELGVPSHYRLTPTDWRSP